ncbi:solute carrier family 35 member F4-like [Paramacrobiotus metropolitanus]|uniref:solute carrier family 35 member F4-like n=1 Tax=Paramacrobiotus metropolitanus TaxID=2943436 RepID=UPI00244576C6|nr:solute carrier family 35 member F4-like [Paramacrobiotus metropolitanus]
MKYFASKRKSVDILSDDEIWTVQGNSTLLAKTRASVVLPVLTKFKKKKSPRRPSTAEELEQAASRRNWILGLILLSAYIALAVATSQLTNVVFRDVDFQAPYLFTLLKMACRITMFPTYLGITFLVRIMKGKKVQFAETLRHCESIYGPDGLTVKILFQKLLPCTVSLILHQIAYTFGIANLSASITTSFFALGVAIAYILSWFVLKQKLLLIKMIFVMVAFGGVALISYASFSENVPNATLGVISTLISVLLLVFHQFAIKLSFPKGDLAQVSLMLSTVTFLVSILFWPMPVITKITGMEEYDITAMPYWYLLPAWFMSAVSSVVYGYGIIVSSPFFMSIGELVILAANSIIDGTLRDFEISIEQIIGTVLVGISFIVMILPDQKVSIRLRKPKPVSTEPSLFMEPVDLDIEAEEKEQEQAEEALEIIHSMLPDAVSIYEGSALEVELHNEEVPAEKNNDDETRF